MITQRFSFSRLILMFFCLLLPGLVQAATYTFGQGWFSAHNPPPCQGGSWSNSGSTYTCSGRVVLGAGDVVIVSTAFLEPLDSITIVATGGFTLAGNTIGTAAKNISLRTDYSTITATGTNTINGSVTSGSGAISLTGTTLNGSLQSNSGSITLNGTSVSGTLTSSGQNNLTNSSINGAANISSSLSATGTSFGSSVTTTGTADFNAGSVAGNLQSSSNVTSINGTTFGGTLTSTNGSVSLGGGSVTGLVRSGCCQVTTNGTNLQAGARSDSAGLSITGGTIQGDFYAANNAANFNGVTMTSGTLTGASTATFTNSTLGSSGTLVTVTTQSGAVNLNNTTAYGDFTAPNYSTIYVNSPSTVTGTCLPHSTPANACKAVPTPTCFTDNYNRSALGSDDWAVTSRNGSFGVPRIISNRLRLTDNSGNVATGATLQRLLPAADNFVQLQFKYYAYNGSGADGIAVTFSDAAVTPQPGGYGGSLGYAQLNGTSGFSGGWLGIALDEFGNFSNPTETRNGGPGARQDSVSIRGSGAGTTGYRYLSGTAANLSPGVDSTSTAVGPGHTYRITLDSRTTGKTMVTVERNTGSGFVTLIPTFDAQAQAGQADLPSDFFMSLTGSTGGSNNIHELDDFQICANRMNPVGQQVDHFEYIYSGNALTCNPQPVTIKACQNASCSSLYTDPVIVTLSPTAAWTATAPASITSGNVLTFSGGTATVQLRRSAGEVTVGESSSIPAVRPLSQRVCSTSGCKITFADTGFLISVPDLIAGKEAEATIQAVRKSDNAAVCVPSFDRVTRDVRLNATYSDPNTGTKSVVINGTAITTTTVAAAASATPTTFSLYFDDKSMVSPKPKVRYNDAGLMTLNASLVDSPANPVITGTDQFVSRPYGLCILTGSQAGTDYSASSPVLANVRAGDLFNVQFRPVIWTSQTDAPPPLVADNICWDKSVPANPIEGTPNYQQTAVPLALAILEPVGGRVADVFGADTALQDPYKYEHLRASSGAPDAPTTIARSIDEVGVFRLTATPPTYLGASMSHAVSQSGRVGRFIPAYLELSGSAALTPSCGAFSYQGQAISFAANQQPRLTVTGYSRLKHVTQNYDRGAFWRLPTPARDNYVSVISNRSGLNARLTQEGTLTTSVIDNIAGDGLKIFSWAGEQLIYGLTNPASLPDGNDYPVAAAVRQGFSIAALTDADGACYMAGGTVCNAYSFDFGGSEIRLGRLRIGNASGSELQSLSLPVTLETWQNVAGGSFQVETGDTCTFLGAATLDRHNGNLGIGETTPTTGQLADGRGNISLSAPGAGNDGSVQASFSSASTWLRYPWDGVSRTEARGLASFGTYKGAAPLIFRRELYR